MKIEFRESLKTLDTSSFDTRNVTTMNSMFGSCLELTDLDLSSFDTSNVTNMSYMFPDCPGITIDDVRHFNTDNVTGYFRFMDTDDWQFMFK